MMRKFVIVLVPLLFLGSACTFDASTLLSQTPQPATNASVSPVSLGGTWETVNTHTRRLQYFFAQEEASFLVLYELDPTAFSLRFEHTDAPATLAQWNELLHQPVMVLNGVYFHEDYLPSGFLVADGKRIGTRIFDVKRSALLVLTPDVAIRAITKKELEAANFTDAAQSYPLLIEQGNIALDDQSDSTDRRTFIGTGKNEKIYVGIVPAASLSLYELTKVLQQLDVPWDVVLNLDGGTSSGLAVNFPTLQETFPNYASIPNVLVIEQKQ